MCVTMVDDVLELSEMWRADFERHERRLRDFGVWVMGVYHFGVWAQTRRSRLARLVGSGLYGLTSVAVELGTGCAIDRTTEIGKGLHLVHAAGVRIHPETVIGEGCGIMNDVTIGVSKKGGRAPRIGNNVFIGAGARILGPVTIGDGAMVAANTLVLTDVPAGATVMGVPGRVLPPARPGRAHGPVVVTPGASADRGVSAEPGVSAPRVR